jgi:hypothetical protein
MIRALPARHGQEVLPSLVNFELGLASLVRKSAQISKKSVEQGEYRQHTLPQRHQ